MIEETQDVDFVDVQEETIPAPKAPTKQEVIEANKFNRMHWKIMNYLSARQRSFEQEYALIYEKKSMLSKIERDYVIFVVERTTLTEEEE